MNKRSIIFITVGIGLYLLLMAAVSASSFARAGGTVNAFSPSSNVDVEADSVGDITSIAGNDNAVQRPYQAESEQHKWGETVMLLGWVALLFSIGVVLFKALGFEFVLVREKSV